MERTNMRMSRKAGERIVVGDSIIEIVEVGRSKVSVRVMAPRDVKVIREELLTRPRTDGATPPN